MFSKLGRFEIKDILGRGAMGEVYLGVDPVLGREVAIKTIISSALPEDQARQRFDREAKAAAVLNSPNIVTIHELGEDQGVLFIAMERLKGQDLEQILLQRGLTLVESLEVLAQVCDGLDAAHRNHIIHRDIKPSNIMVMREGRKLLVKLMDFGVARLKDSAMTVVGTVMGTVNYIAPEYIKSGEPDARSDLFAVGVMLYECISGRKPFDGGTASTVLFKIVNDPPAPLDLSMLHGLSPALRNMTERALAKDPEDRFQSAEEFALALRAAKDPAWNGKIEETTLRMKIQPMLAHASSPMIQPPVAPPAVSSSSPATVVVKMVPDFPVPDLPVPDFPVPDFPVPDTSTPSAMPDEVTPPKPASNKEITQELEITPGPAATHADRTETIQASDRVAPSRGSASHAIGTQPPLAKPMLKAPAIVPPVPVPHTARTEVLKLPQVSKPAPYAKPPLPVPSTLEVAAAQAGTGEVVVKPLEPAGARTEVVRLPEPPPVLPLTAEELTAQAGTGEIVVKPLEPAGARTEVVRLPEPPPVLPLTAEELTAQAGTGEIVVKPLEPAGARTEVVGLPEPPPVLPLTAEELTAQAGTGEIVVMPKPASAGPADRTEFSAPAPALEVIPAASREFTVLTEVPSWAKAPAEPPVEVSVTDIAVLKPPAAPPPSHPTAPIEAKGGSGATLLAEPPQGTIPETFRESSVPVPATKTEDRAASQPPSRSSKSLLYSVLGLTALVLLAGLGYFFFKAQGVQPPSVAPVLPPPPAAPPSVPAPEAPAPEPAQQLPTAPSATPVKSATIKAKVKAPAKAPAPVVKVQAPEPAPAPEVVAPPPPAPVAAEPPPVLDEKAKKKLRAAEELRKRLAREDQSNK